MGWTGKILGFIVGYGLGNHIGAVIGLFAGHVFDVSYAGSNPFTIVPAQQRYEIQQAYFRTTFLVMGHIAKSDGRVSEDEIRAARTIMQNMKLNERQKREAIHLFNEGKRASFNLNQALDDLFRACGPNQQMLYRMFIDIQFRAAVANGALSPNKQQILQTICQRFAFSYQEFAAFYGHYGAHEYTQSHTGSQRQRHHGHRQQSQQRPRKDYAIENAYALLGVNKNTPDAEVKKAYRKKMSQNHPDKLISKGLPEEMIKLANQKTQEIKQAYDTIVAARGK